MKKSGYDMPIGHVLRLLGALLFAAGFSGSAAALNNNEKIVVLVSMNIKPFVEATEGIREVLGSEKGLEPVIIYMDRYETPDMALPLEELRRTEAVNFIAVGPEAMVTLWQHFNEPKYHKVFAMVLNPEKLMPEEKALRGISLNLPAETQIRQFRALFPMIKRIGLLFNPAHNQPFFLAAESAAKEAGIAIVPLSVTSPADLPETLTRGWRDIDGLWFIPDQTIISESIINYITKESISRGVAVFGYNRFFHDSGAAMSFILDYRQIGRRSMELMLTAMKSEAGAGILPPEFTLKVNKKIINKLGIVLQNGSFPAD